MASQGTEQQNPRTPMRVVELLRVLGESQDNLTLSDIARRLAMPKSSTLVLLRSLLATNFVEQVDGAYRLGNEALKLAALMTTNQRRDKAMHRVLRGITAATGETAQLSILAPDEPVALCIDLCDSPQPLRYSLYIGLRRPLYCTSIGKLILAFAEPAWVDAYFARLDPVSFNENTVTSEAEIRQQLLPIRDSGLSLSHQGVIVGASGLSAAVFDASGRMHFGLTIGAPTARMLPALDHNIQTLRDAAIEASALNGYFGPYPAAALT